MNKGLFSNRGNNRFESGEVVYSAQKPADGFIPLDGTNRKWFERGVNKNFSPTMASNGYIAWTTQTFNFGTTAVQQIAYGNNLWVAVGNAGQIRTSTDAITWVTRTSNFGTTSIRSVAYGNSLWVVGGESGQLRTSTDAITWVTRTSNFGLSSIISLAYGNNLWVAAGQAGQIRTSTDTVTWVTRDSSWSFSDTTDLITKVSYNNNIWIAVGYSYDASFGDKFAEIRTSTDTITWDIRNPVLGPLYYFYSVAFQNNTWVVVGDYGQIQTSTDTITWVTRLSPFEQDTIYTISSGNGIFIAASGSKNMMCSSTDGILWKKLNPLSLVELDTTSSIAYGNGIWLAGSFNGQLQKSNNTYTYRPKITHGWIKP